MDVALLQEVFQQLRETIRVQDAQLERIQHDAIKLLHPDRWADVSLWLIPPAGSLPIAWAMLLGGIFLNGVAGGAYIGAGLGQGPRDGLMTGLVRRTSRSVRVIRTGIELAVVAAGWLLGGTLGIGTLLYAVAIGPIVHRMLPLFTIPQEQLETAATPCEIGGCVDYREAA